MPGGDLHAVPAGEDDSAREVSADFMKRAGAFAERTKAVSLDVLIWGPDPASATPVAKKRIEIRAALVERNFAAVFSEDIPAHRDDGLMPREFDQARAAHLLICLIEDAPGASAEVYSFCNHPDIAPKIRVMCPVEYKGGYAAEGPLKELEDGWGGVRWYTPEELERSDVVTTAVNFAEARRNSMVMYRAI